MGISILHRTCSLGTHQILSTCGHWKDLLGLDRLHKLHSHTFLINICYDTHPPLIIIQPTYMVLFCFIFKAINNSVKFSFTSLNSSRQWLSMYFQWWYTNRLETFLCQSILFNAIFFLYIINFITHIWISAICFTLFSHIKFVFTDRT